MFDQIVFLKIENVLKIGKMCEEYWGNQKLDDQW